MRWWNPFVFCFAFMVFSVPAVASDLEKAPPPFSKDGKWVVPIDIQNVSVHYTFDYTKQKATGVAKVKFLMGSQEGYPFLDLVPAVQSIALNGEALPTSAFPAITPSGSSTRIRVVERELAAGSANELDLTFDISDEVTFSQGAVKVGFFFSDLSDRSYFEAFGPANLEFDQIAFEFSVSVVGATKEHAVFANGEIVQNAENSWFVKYPDYFTSSSLYFHLSPKSDFTVKEFTYDGISGPLPVTIYSKDAGSVTSAHRSTLATMKKLEERLGAFAHDKLVIYVAGLGGMEYSGATMTSLSALAHELTHSWFARGVMPANGNSGWIDEAIASWQDNDFRTGSGAPNRAPVNLANFSPYRRHTPMESYTKGEALIAEFDYMFRNLGGMTPILRNLFDERKRSTITVDYFHRFIESQTNQDLQAIFDRYVYGKSIGADGVQVVVSERYVPVTEIVARGHPRPYTKEELMLHR